MDYLRLWGRVLVSSEQEDPRKKLLSVMTRTKGVRFNASSRLYDYERRVNRNNAYASVAVIFFTLLPAFFSLPSFWTAVIALMTVGLSIFILVFTLLHSASNSALKADQFRRCALDVNALRRELMANTEADISRFVSQYDEILVRYNLNHEDVDYYKYCLEHPEEFSEAATEEMASARANVLASGGWMEKFSFRLTIMTIIVIFFSIASAQAPILQEILTNIKELVFSETSQAE
jgi:hypothetical protein